MPLFEYECKKCGIVFEVLQKSSDPPLTIHDHCGGNLEKLFSTAVFQFKGSGWYVTDYAKKSSTSTPKDEKPSVSEVKKEPLKSPSTDGQPARS